MVETTRYQRLLDEGIDPTESLFEESIGKQCVKLWSQLREFLDQHYDFAPELHFIGKKYGWGYKYRRSKKTLCVLFPETGAFTVLITLGKREVEQVKDNFNTFSPETQKVFDNTRQFHDGKWIYRRVLDKDDLKDVIEFIKIKKKPKHK